MGDPPSGLVSGLQVMLHVNCQSGFPRGEAGEGSRLPDLLGLLVGARAFALKKFCPSSVGVCDPRGPVLGQLRGPSGTESVTLSGTAPGWEPPDDPDTGSECSHPEVSPSPRFVAAKTQTNQSGKKAPASVVRCATLLHRTPPATQTQTFRTPNSGSPASKATAGTSGLCYSHTSSTPALLPTCHSCARGHCSLARTRVEPPWLSGTHLGPGFASDGLCDHGKPPNLSESRFSYPQSEGCTRGFCKPIFFFFKQETVFSPSHGLGV